jgi:hypothetical protein
LLDGEVLLDRVTDAVSEVDVGQRVVTAQAQGHDVIDARRQVVVVVDSQVDRLVAELADASVALDEILK